jgi:hypothetical protein
MRDEKIKVSIIIPHYNQKECLQRLFPNIVDQTLKDFEVIIIDDCTPDEATISFVREFIKDKPNMHLVQNTVNMRFVKTCNKGIALAKGEYICLLNSDTEVKNTFVQRNVEILDSDATIGGLTCVVVDQSGQNWFSGGRYSNVVAYNLKDDFQGVRSVDFVAGTAAFYRREVFDRVGLFDENYIMYHEDVEFGLRVKYKTDYRLCTFSEKLVTHILLPSIPRSDVYYYGSRNLVLLSRKYAPKYLPLLMMHIIVYYIVNNLARASIHMLTLKTSSASLRMLFAVASLRGTINGIMARQTQHVHADITKPR